MAVGNMGYETLQVSTRGEAFYSLTEDVRRVVRKCADVSGKRSGIAHLFVMHTSCALAISESYDPLAKRDVEHFLQHLAPRELPFIQHTLEGPDDSPSHMKSVVLHQHLACLVEDRDLVQGTWQGIFLAEFRDHPHERRVLVKMQWDG